jgi:hypothetical protein
LATQILLPSWCLPRRAYSVDVVGLALQEAEQGQPPRAVAATVGAPVSTVRGWLGAVTGAAAALTRQAVGVAGVFGDAQGCWPPLGLETSALTAVVWALVGAARAWRAAAARPRPSGRVGAITGIDYLGSLVEDLYRVTLRRLRVVDPTGALDRVSGWQLVNVITAGRLLSTHAH